MGKSSYFNKWYICYWKFDSKVIVIDDKDPLAARLRLSSFNLTCFFEEIEFEDIIFLDSIPLQHLHITAIAWEGNVHYYFGSRPHYSHCAMVVLIQTRDGH